MMRTQRPDGGLQCRSNLESWSLTRRDVQANQLSLTIGARSDIRCERDTDGDDLFLRPECIVYAFYSAVHIEHPANVATKLNTLTAFRTL